MKQELRARLARLGPIRGIDRVLSGSAADFELRPKGALAKVRTIDAVQALVRFGVGGKAAKQAVEDMVELGLAVIEVPLSGAGFEDAMRAAGIEAVRLLRLEAVDVKAVRSRIGLSARAFALRYRLNPRTVEGWEQGRPMDDAALAYLHAISHDPEAIAAALPHAAE